MGIEGKERQRGLETGAQVLSGQLGKTIQRLRKAYNLSLSELAEQSGVAKSIISQIERNETNPTLATIWRLSQALDVSIERVLATRTRSRSSSGRRGPTRRSWSPKTARCGSAIIGWIKTIEWLQWYDVQSDPGGVLDSDGHQRGSVECLSVTGGRVRGRGRRRRSSAPRPARPCATAATGPTSSAASARAPGRAFMVCILKAAVMD